MRSHVIYIMYTRYWCVQNNLRYSFIFRSNKESECIILKNLLKISCDDENYESFKHLKFLPFILFYDFTKRLPIIFI